MIALALLLLLQTVQPPPTAVSGPLSQVPDDYLIGVADVLDVTVFNEPDASRAGVAVDSDGTIDCPYIGRLKVAGLTPRGVETAVRERLAKGFLVNPSVNVTIVKYRSKTVNVQGYVRSPSEYILQGNVSLASLLAQAGSFSPDAGSYVIISRLGANGQAEQTRVTRKDIESGLAQNIFLKDGDTVLVPKAETFLINGYVRSPGSYKWEDGLTLERALTLAGGPTERAKVSGTEILRVVNGKPQKPIKAKLGDLILANDTIRVPQRIF
jgi:polysaccharide export outer membrane protein